MLSMYLRVLRTLANTGQLKGSIDNATENVKDILKDIEGTSVTHPAPFEVYSPTYQEARKAEYTGGKAGIGPFALNNAHHILTQLTKLKMASNPFTEAMQITDLSRIFDIPTDTDPRGGRILDWLSAMINAFVDIAKDPYIVRLNVNGWTYNMVSFLLRAGKGKQTFYFMYQPILREMAQEVLKTKGKYGVDRTKTPSQLEQEAIQRVLDKYDKDGKFQKKYRQINQDDELSATTYSNLFKTFINDKGEESSALREMLKDPEYVGDFNESQVMIYYAWLKLKPYADSLANLVKYSKIDTKKIGKSFAEQQNYYDGMMRMLDDPNFAEGEIRKFYDETFVGHKTENAIPFGISIFKNLLLRNTQLFTDQKNVILSLLGRRGIADSGLINAIIKGMEAQAKAQFFNDYIKSNNIDLQGMFKGQMSMAKRLNNFKQLILRRDPRMSHLIDNTGHITNDFIEFLLPNIQNTEDRPNELDFIDTSDLLNVDQAKANNLINYWRELIEDPNPQISKLFKDLVVYAFITTGDNPTMNSFFQYVPNSYRIQMGYRDFMRGQLDKFSNESTASYPDKDDFFRNNWHNDKLVKPVELTNSRGNGLLGIYYNNHMPNIVMGARLGNRGLQQAIKPINWITNVADGKKYPVFAPYVKISDSRFNRPENWHLYTLIGYKYDGDSKKYIPIYGLISKKGYKYRGHTVTEYGVQTQFDFNIEPEWNYTEAMNNPTQIADMAESAFAGMGDFWYDVKPISSLVTYQNSNYLHSMIDTVVEEDTQADNVPLEEVDEPAEEVQPSTQQTINVINNPDNFTLHSGGALGADSMWGQIAEEYGIPNTPDRQMHYYNNQPTPKGNVQISAEDYEEGRYKVAEAAKANWGYQYKTMKDDRLIRNWSQVKHSDAIYAIGTMVKEGERIFPNQPGDTRTAKHTAVTGGTGYAVEMAIQAGKPVYVFDQSRNRWFKNINGEWSASEVPTLTPNFAGIGTRQIQQNGINAIRDVFENTFNSNQQDNQQTIQSMDELVTTDLSAVDYMVKYDRAVKQLNTVLDQMELTSDERNQYYLDFNNFLQQENEAGNLQNNEQIEGVVNKFICNL